MIREWKDEHPHIKEKMAEDKSYIRTIKKDWYGQDFKYLSENRNNIFVDEFLKLDKVDDYLDFFPASIMNEKLDYIKNFYSSKEKKIVLDHYKYLTKEQMDTFVLTSSDHIIEILMNLNKETYVN